MEDKIIKYGYAGITLFVAIPLPITGAYTGTLVAWLMGLDAKKTFISVLAGVVISGIIVTIISYYGIAAFSIFIKISTHRKDIILPLQLKDELNEKQYQAAIQLEGPLLVIAGAGSGKTRMITYRMAYMLESEYTSPTFLP